MRLEFEGRCKGAEAAALCELGGRFLRISVPFALFKKTNEERELFGNYFWLVQCGVFFPTMMLSMWVLFCSAHDSI